VLSCVWWWPQLDIYAIVLSIGTRQIIFSTSCWVKNLKPMSKVFSGIWVKLEMMLSYCLLANIYTNIMMYVCYWLSLSYLASHTELWGFMFHISVVCTGALSHTCHNFQCKTTNHCIFNRYRCDGFINCFDASDEIGCGMRIIILLWSLLAAFFNCLTLDDWLACVIDFSLPSTYCSQL